MPTENILGFNANNLRLRTITFGIPKSFYEALGTDLGVTRMATDTEVEEYLRDVLKQNMDFIVEQHRPKKKKLVIKRHR